MIFSEKKHIVFVVAHRLSAATFQTFGKTISAALQKWNSTCPKERFEEFSREKHYITFTVSRLWAKNIRTFRKKLQQAHQNCLQHLQGSVLRYFLEKFTCSSSLSHYAQKNKSTFGGNFSLALSKCYESWGTFWGETFFFDKTKTMFFRLPHFERNFLGLLTETFQQVCQNRSLRLQRKILTIFFCKMNILFIIFVFNPQNSFQLFSKCLASLSKMQHGCSGDNLRASDFWRNTNDFHHFRTMNENISNLWRKKFRHGCQNWLLRVQRNLWWSFFAKFKIHLIIFGIWVKYC